MSIAVRHHKVSGAFALLLSCREVGKGSRAAAPTVEYVEIPSVRPSAPLWLALRPCWPTLRPC